MDSPGKRTRFRSFRLPLALDNSTRRAARDAGHSQTAIVVRILAEALRNGLLPAPVTEDDKAQLRFL